jgi:hypothetical protein
LSARTRGVILLITLLLLGVAAVRLAAQGGTPAFVLHNLGSMAAFVGVPLLLALGLGGLSVFVSRRFGERGAGE